MGAWIETPKEAIHPIKYGVAPLWVRGLKLYLLCQSDRRCRRTLMGAWIETSGQSIERLSNPVAPLWVRGLKRTEHGPPLPAAPSHPYGCVD